MKTIYICCDQQVGLDIRSASLEMAGYDVQTFRTGGDLVRALNDDDPDLVLIDVLLAGKNGFEVCESLNLKGHHGLKVALFAGIYNRPAFRELANQLGVAAYVEESLDRDGLLELVTRLTYRDGPRADVA